MDYVSTRGNAPVLDFEDVLLAGLARDGGLYVPAYWPKFSAEDLRAMRGLSYPELAVRVMKPFVGDSISDEDFERLVARAYAGFDHDAVAPLKQLSHDFWLMELFHGPTIAFKDYALQLVGLLFDHFLTRRGERVTIVGATSGDTGSAAIEACRDREAIDIFVMFPEGRVSPVQQRQMTTVLSSNVHNLAVEGTFDDCQDLVKGMFADEPFRDAMHLSAVNSINWARVMAQIVYYFHGALSLGAPDRPVSFSVPTGNFGNVFAAYGARKMGLPIDQLIIGSNSNDILTRFFETGTMSARDVVPSMSPSMDIQISSNFERFLFDLYDRDGAALSAVMQEFRRTGELAVGAERWSLACESFDARRLDDAETLAAIGALHKSTGELIDPHSAIGIVAGMEARRRADVPLVCLATAHPAKFPDAVEKATGKRPPLPTHMADLFERDERFDKIGPSLQTVEQYVRENSRIAGGKA
ncbi:threonine synthase [Hwanghaeella grinnelliae]|uniref:Threonine synthase n=1 Tax=Hwanghaeella grinnelliae TaxID=2500179 RepID=A0A437QKN6_9PROT|nr:threonine synthase [Hwanghaeella grinnelliae]RVU35056.1 threonine synthase [Hwanghaeella grinnelliae]